MAVSEVDSTRVFVKGLPPSFTSDQLASHFRQQYQVSDAHVIPDRRIGFVGFHDNESAQNAVKFFNRSYIRMSKISVDLARPVEMKHHASGQAMPVSQRTASHPTRSRDSKERHTDRQEPASRKRKREGKDDGEAARAEEGSRVNTPELEAAGKENGTVQDTATTGEEEKHTDLSKSDNDWLRGKTSRLLDLVEPEVVSTSEDMPKGELQPETTAIDLEQPEMEANITDTSEIQGDRKVPNGRLFIRNLAYDVTDADLEDRFGKYGKIQTAHVVKDARKSTSKGLAFLQFSDPDAAGNALRSLDGVSFHGRLLHILPAFDQQDQGLTDFEISKMPLKKQKAVKRKMEAGSATFSWNSLYMNPDAVVSSIADRLGVAKSEILDPTSANAAVKQAHAETQLIAETKEFLRNHGVNVEAFKNQQRDDRTLLLKNFLFGTTERELKELLEPFGQISKFIFPPAGTMALVQFSEPYFASQALKQLAYKNIKGTVLYLERAPRNLLNEKNEQPVLSAERKETRISTDDETGVSTAKDLITTLFVRNLNFTTTTARLTEAFGSLPGFLSARVKTRTDPKRPGEILSSGFGFIEFKNKACAETAISTLNGHRLDGHEVVVQPSTKTADLAEEQRKEAIAKKTDANRTKIIIKNLPFQTSKKDIRSLFAQYGQLKTVRVPKKFDNSSRGFGFAEFITAKEAQNAVDALSNTHLLGRRLVLEFAQEEEIDPEQQIQAMEKKMERQNDRIQLSKLTGTGRKKFVIGMDEDEAT